MIRPASPTHRPDLHDPEAGAACGVRTTRPPADTPRNRHYGHFYGFHAVPDDRPLLLVHGNCQAESLRVLLEGHHGDRVTTVRLVPAHEMELDDVAHLARLAARASYVVTQPIVDGYRGLPIGSRELAAMAPRASTALVPVLRWAGLHPAQVIVRSAAGDPPVVPYHDLRTIAACLDGRRPEITPASARALREASLAELARRIDAHGAVDVRDAFTRRGRRSSYVINHPTNDVLTEVALAVAARLGLGDGRAFDVGRVLLGRIVAPVDPFAADAAGLALSADDVERIWRIDGTAVPDVDVAAAQASWYRGHPEALTAAATRHVAALRLVREAS